MQPTIAGDLAGLRQALAPDPGDPQARRRLLRMKRAATGALAAAAALYLAMVLLGADRGVLGFVRAGAEAAMVGGLADWFAVTALFRHPLGLPIPHTALIPRKKDELGTKLGEFVTGHFLTAESVTAQLAEARLVHRLAGRLADPETADLLSRELAGALSAVLGALDERNVSAYVLELARRDLDRRSYTPVLGRFLMRAVEGRGQRPLVDLLVRSARVYLTAHRDELRPQVKHFLEGQGILGWLVATDRRSSKALDEALVLLAQVEADDAHPLRGWLDGLLVSIAADLQTDVGVAGRVDGALRRLLEDPYVQGLLHAVVSDVLASTRLSLADAEGGLQQRLALLVRDVGDKALQDPAFEARIEALLEQSARYLVEHYGGTVVSLIQRTVAGWEGKDASERIEVAVGRDLQFIRINGTVVGALAGLAIHAVTVTLA